MAVHLVWNASDFAAEYVQKVHLKVSGTIWWRELLGRPGSLRFQHGNKLRSLVHYFRMETYFDFIQTSLILSFLGEHPRIPHSKRAYGAGRVVSHAPNVLRWKFESWFRDVKQETDWCSGLRGLHIGAADLRLGYTADWHPCSDFAWAC